MTMNFTNPAAPTPEDDKRAQYYYGGSQTGAQEDVNRDRLRAVDQSQRQAYQNDFSQSNQARGVQMGALGYLQGAASGNAPSEAALLAKQANESAIQGGMSMAASVKGGPGARIAAMRNARMGAATQAAQGAQTAAMARANEMATARGQLAQAATATRGSDINAAQLQQQSELQQRQLNDAGEQFYEGQATGIKKAALDANLQRKQQDEQLFNQQRGLKLQDEKQDWDKKKDIFSTAAGAAGGLVKGIGSLFSDERAKDGIESLSHIGTTSFGPAQATFDKVTPGGSLDVLGSLKAHSDFATQFQSNPGAGPSMVSDMRTKEPFYGGGPMLSDERAKGPTGELADEIKKGTEGADPYRRAPEFTKGVAGAPRGYAASRAGQEGYMFGGAPEPDASLSGDTKSGGAPGTDDWAKYGAPGEKGLKKTMGASGSKAAQEAGIDWTKGGSTKSEGPKGNWSDIVGDILGGASGKPMTSDERAKSRDGADDAMAEANRAMEAKSYFYKPEFKPPEQAPGERNVGPMAQSMAKDPVARTAITKDPETGMLAIDRDKGLKLAMGGIADLQEQLDDLKKRGAK